MSSLDDHLVRLGGEHRASLSVGQAFHVCTVLVTRSQFSQEKIDMGRREGIGYRLKAKAGLTHDGVEDLCHVPRLGPAPHQLRLDYHHLKTQKNRGKVEESVSLFRRLSSTFDVTAR